MKRRCILDCTSTAVSADIGFTWVQIRAILPLIVLEVLMAFSEHLTVESYTVFICQQSHLLLFGIPSPTHSFFPGLKPSFSTNLSHCSPSLLFLLKYLLHGFPGLFTVISERICFLLLVFLFFFTF